MFLFRNFVFFFNLFLWNDHRQARTAQIKTSDLFNKDGTFKGHDKEAIFRGWCHEYISFLRGDNPFTFPYRLPPPEEMMAKFDRTKEKS